MAAGSFVTSFLGALQASVAVLLTIGYGLIATQFRILSESSAKDISKLCVRVFLPALLITNVGSELHASTAGRYVPILIWTAFYIGLSMGLGLVLTKVFKLPAWTTPAISFNNTTSLPLLLVQSLDAAGILSNLLIDENDTTGAAVKRAKSYFLVCAMVSNSLTFAMGPKLLDWEEAPDEEGDKAGDDDASGSTVHDNGDVEAGTMAQNGQNVEGNEGSQDEGGEEVNEGTSLIPDTLLRPARRTGAEVSKNSVKFWDHLPGWLRSTLDFLYAFLNAPLIGAVIGGVLGITPPLHRAFFDPTEEGGIFKAWLTTSVENVGDLFAALQLVVVGAKLGRSLRKWKLGEDSGTLPWLAMGIVFGIRFVIWPL